jgi:superfamily II DNA/RNA helicase
MSSFDPSRFINKAVITEQVEHFTPEHKFADFLIEEKLKENIIKKGYVLPTPIQDRSIPHILRGADVVGIANTGTGKTAAFLIPLINKILLNKNERVLVMVPTRELAVQIGDELRGFAPGLGIYSAICVGGAGIGPQISDLRRKPNFVIGTPGRLKDLLERKALNLSTFNTAVLDEADRMLDMGFINDMRTILSLLPSPRHTLFFSATLSTEIERLIGEFLNEPVRISVKTQESAASIEQDIVRVPRGTDKLNVLHDLLIQPEFNKVLIFGRTKHGVEKLSKTLVAKGFKSESIHGNKTQNKRQRALDLFKRDHVKILVATDVAARGLDISGVSHVINYDLPSSHEDYIHRIGRTGRAGKKGKALTFIEG